MTMRKTTHVLLVSFMILVVAAFVMPVLIVLMNSFKGQFYISNAPFAFPSKETFVGFKNVCSGETNVIFITNPLNEDLQHPIHVKNIQLVDTTEQSKIFIHRPDLR